MKKSMRRLAILVVCLTLILVMAVPSFAATGVATQTTVNGKYPVGVTAAMTDASYWVNLANANGKTTGASNIMMTAAEIDALNKKIIETKGTYVEDLTKIDGAFDAATLRDKLAQNAVPSWDVYIKGQLVNKEQYYASINDAIKRTGWSNKNQRPLYAIATTIVNVKSLPTSDMLCDSLTDTADEIQSSSLLVNEPFLVKQQCTFNGELFYYGYTENCTGWVNAKNVAICGSKSEWTEAWQTKAGDKDILVVIGDRFELEESLFVPNSSKLELTQGTILKLVPEKDIPVAVGRRSTWFNHVVYVPVRKADGTYSREMALVAMNSDVSVGFLPFTQENLLKLAFADLGNRYGWGNMLGATDCSGMQRNIYRCFGFMLPRNTTWQQLIPGATLDLSGMSDYEKIQCISTMPAGTLLYFPGHEVMYTGTVNNMPYAISNTGKLYESVGEMELLDGFSVILNPLSVRRGNGSTWLTNIKTAVIVSANAKSKVYIPAGGYIFADVKSGDYFYEPVKWAVDKKITTGVDASHFAPNATVTENQLYLLVTRCLGDNAAAAEYVVKDPNHNLTRAEAVEMVKTMSGTDVAADTSLSPESPCTRAMAVTWLYRTFGTK